MGGCNKRPVFDTDEHWQWYDHTPKRVLYELLRDAEIQLSMCDDVGSWLANTKARQDILRANGII